MQNLFSSPQSVIKDACDINFEGIYYKTPEKTVYFLYVCVYIYICVCIRVKR